MIKNRISLGINCNTCEVRHLCIPRDLMPSEVDEFNDLLVNARSIAKKEQVFNANVPMQNLYAVTNGSCKEYWIDVNGSELVTNFYFPGDIIGIESVAGQKHLFSVSALEDTQLCVIPINKFLQVMQQTPGILKRYVNVTSLKMQNDQSLRFGVTAMESVCDFLLNIALRMRERNPAQSEFSLTMSQIDISNFLGIAYETVNRIFKSLQRKKIITLKNKTLKILRISELERLGRLDYA